MTFISLQLTHYYTSCLICNIVQKSKKISTKHLEQIRAFAPQRNEVKQTLNNKNQVDVVYWLL